MCCAWLGRTSEMKAVCHKDKAARPARMKVYSRGMESRTVVASQTGMMLMSFNLSLSSVRRPLSDLIQAVGVLALLCAIAAPAQAQTTNPRIPSLTCGTHPAVLNTAIDGKNGYNNASSPLLSGTDAHWDWASSTIQYPSNVGLNYPKSNVSPGNAATDQPAVTTDSIGIGGRLIKNPQADIIDSAWSVAPV